MHRYFLSSILAVYTILFFLSCTTPQEEEKVVEGTQALIFSKTLGFRHECIEPGGEALKQYFATHGIHSIQTEDASVFSKTGLDDFDVVVFFQTTGNVLDSVQEEALVAHVKSGKGFVGIHSAADTEYDWPWYGQLIGAQFASHPQIQEATLMKTDTQHMACKHLPERWTRTDEWYNFKAIPLHTNVLLTIDESTYEGGAHDSIHPVSWYHKFEGGRVFYTAMGHTVESYQDTLFLKHITEGLKWTATKE